MRRWLAGLAVLACVTTACASTVDGHGQLGRAGGRVPGQPSSGPDFSSPPPSSSTLPNSPGPTGSVPTGVTPTSATPSGPATNTTPPTTTCPTITYPYAHVRFSCITTGLETSTTPDQVWPVNLSKSVESTWGMSEGAGHWGTPDGQSLAAIATNVRTQMLQENPPAYGTSPTVQTTSSKATAVGGADAWVLQTTFTLNATFRQARHLTVKVEKSWIVAITVGVEDVSLWYVTIPDDASDLWDKVPAVIDTIKII